MVPCSSAQCVPVDLGSTDKVLEEFDNVMCQNVATAAQNPTYLVDASSILWRLEVRTLVPRALSCASGERQRVVPRLCIYRVIAKQQYTSVYTWTKGLMQCIINNFISYIVISNNLSIIIL